MWFLRKLHALCDTALCYLKLVQRRQVGWLTWDRKSGFFIHEQQTLWKKLKLLLLFNPVMEWIDKSHYLRLWTHKKNIQAGQSEGRPQSHAQIKAFIDYYHIDMSAFQPSNPESYRTFEDFFIRKFDSNARPIFAPDDPTKAIVVSDSRLVVYPTLERIRALWIKGSQFTIHNLIQEDERSFQWKDGSIASFRLSPQDYHRYHSPVKGTVKWYKHIPGDYLQVDPVALHTSVNILTENARSCVCIESKEFGDILLVAIGATDVGSVEIHDEIKEKGHIVQKGEELGLFQFGGSSIIVAFERGRINFDDDLGHFSNQEVMVDVEVGMSLGKASQYGPF
ncbi:hypothetical protein N7492_000891 [Penicillium capsulatum]|uniref:phosphatidylserine decarboxylase n=1 Tax=Penicillium capsulatum TaxID=69766 RepID=A0A9W9IRB4_9EURO|nr:hypothetical protein N7492_000891 [Penicillium capsulatum]KAJ6130052.1 hypothetical protein N7512_002832 [Penicillium capsulatum]